ncbi:MAG: hypothetical protein EBU46_04975 [Nitrosomonadaceae bacterium]|nr:lipoprotein [Nitrosomonas sp.]NBQ68207.1 hypothetical protein [Nitrosomonadaceae bacterium]UJP00732.1 MAG: lipoprotein [Nitrosomonas sp.]UJP07843.1 MAG: lipoprotein [Nitrosomonas sp.]
MRLILVLLCSAYLLSACGLKGPLYLPKVEEAGSAQPHQAEKK